MRRAWPGSLDSQGLWGLVKEDLGLYSKGKRKNFHKGMTELDFSFTQIVLALLLRRIQSLSSRMRSLKGPFGENTKGYVC